MARSGSRKVYRRLPMATTSRIPSVGFIGLGVMGEPMAGHLSKAGHALALFDVRAGQATRLASTLPGASAPASPAEVARRSDIVITMVPNGEVVRDLVAGPRLLAAFAPARCCSSVVLGAWLTHDPAACSRSAVSRWSMRRFRAPPWGAEQAELVSWSAASRSTSRACGRC